MEAGQPAQPTGTNRSNPPDPDRFPAKGKTENRPRAAASAIPEPTGAPPPPAADAFLARIHKSPPFWAPGSTHRSSRWAEGPPGAPFGQTARRCARGSQTRARARPQGGLASLVATARGQTPDPIPNSAVKTLSADGTAAQAAEEQVAARLAKPPQPRTPHLPPRGPADAASSHAARHHTSPRGGAAGSSPPSPGPGS